MASVRPRVPASPCRWSSSTSRQPWARRFRWGCQGSENGRARGSDGQLCRQGGGEWGLQQEKGTASVGRRPFTLLWMPLQEEQTGYQMSAELRSL